MTATAQSGRAWLASSGHGKPAAAAQPHIPGVSPARSCRTPRLASHACQAYQGRNSGPGASHSRAQGRRGLIAGSLQQGAPLGHEVEEFDGG